MLWLHLMKLAHCADETIISESIHVERQVIKPGMETGNETKRNRKCVTVLSKYVATVFNKQVAS